VAGGNKKSHMEKAMPFLLCTCSREMDRTSGLQSENITHSCTDQNCENILSAYPGQADLTIEMDNFPPLLGS